MKAKIKSFLLRLVKKYLLMDHKFLPSTLIRTRGSSSLFEVEAVMYDLELKPVLITKRYGSTTGKVYSITHPGELEFIEHKGMAHSGTDIS